MSWLVLVLSVVFGAAAAVVAKLSGPPEWLIIVGTPRPPTLATPEHPTHCELTYYEFLDDAEGSSSVP